MRIAFHAAAEKELQEVPDYYDLKLRDLVESENKSVTFSGHLFSY